MSIRSMIFFENWKVCQWWWPIRFDFFNHRKLPTIRKLCWVVWVKEKVFIRGVEEKNSFLPKYYLANLEFLHHDKCGPGKYVIIIHAWGAEVLEVFLSASRKRVPNPIFLIGGARTFIPVRAKFEVWLSIFPRIIPETQITLKIFTNHTSSRCSLTSLRSDTEAIHFTFVDYRYYPIPENSINSWIFIVKGFHHQPTPTYWFKRESY